MKKLRKLALIVPILGVVALSGCNSPVHLADDTPTASINGIVATELPTEEPPDIQHIKVLDAVLAYIRDTYPRFAPAENLTWNSENITQEGIVGSSSFQYTAEDWIIIITAPVVAPNAVIYQVEVMNQASSFRLTGEVDVNDNITEISSTGGGIAVVAWLGYVVSTPQGAQFDDYVVILPEGNGEFGIEGSDDAINEQIIALRDKDEPGKYAHFWGILNCEIPDYGGCQLLVDRIRTGTEITQPEAIDSWYGKIYSSDPGMQFDDYFVLDGDYPIKYGIASFQAKNGFLIYDEELESLRNTDQIVKISGELICGVPDSNGCQIQVSSLEVNGTAVDPYQGWLKYVNDDYDYQFRYPARATIHESGVMGFPTEELPQGMSIDDYIAQLEELYGDRLCVSLKFSSGYIHISPPENESFKYALCGRTGVGAGELIDRSEEVYVAGDFYPSDGFEFIGNNDASQEHDETFVIRLPDGTRIEYGSMPLQEADYQEYLTMAKPVLLQILSTYEGIK